MPKYGRHTLEMIGHTPDGRTVWGGVYSFYETHGLPLSDILLHLWRNDALPDWDRLLGDMVSAGRSLDRSVETVVAAIDDACYPQDVRDKVITRLRKITEEA